MNRSAILNSLFWALTFGTVVAVLSGSQRAVSLRVWLAAVVIWFATSSVRRLLDGIPLVPASFRPLQSFRRTGVTVDGTRLRELRALEGLLLRASKNDRAYAQQLHPRVVMLADHFLPVNHGIDRHREPERAAELLGSVGWLLEPDTGQRTPTLDELDELVRILTGTESTTTKRVA